MGGVVDLTSKTAAVYIPDIGVHRPIRTPQNSRYETLLSNGRRILSGVITGHALISKDTLPVVSTRKRDDADRYRRVLVALRRALCCLRERRFERLLLRLVTQRRRTDGICEHTFEKI